jgi:hypothetical protein
MQEALALIKFFLQDVNYDNPNLEVTSTIASNVNSSRMA